MTELINTLKEYLTAERIATISSWIITFASLFTTFRSLTKKTISVDEALTKVNEAVSKAVTTTSQKAMASVTAPIATQVSNITPYLEAITKILALSQDDSTSSKLAVLEVIKGLGGIATVAAEEVEAKINEQIANAEEAEAEKQELLNSLVDNETKGSV